MRKTNSLRLKFPLSNQLIYPPKNNHSLQEELPSDIARVREPGLRHLSAHRVDDGGHLFLREEMRDGTGNDELGQVDEQVFHKQLLLFQEENEALALKEGSRRSNIIYHVLTIESPYCLPSVNSEWCCYCNSLLHSISGFIVFCFRQIQKKKCN